MKTLRPASLLLPLAALLAAAPMAVAGEIDDGPPNVPFKPKEYELSKYSANFERKSPFEYDPPAVKEVPKGDPFEGISLGGFCGDGNRLTVYLLMGKEKKRVTVHGEGSAFRKLDSSGFRIVSIKRAKSVSATTVILEKDGETGEVRFEKDTLMAKGQGGQKAGQGQVVMGPDGKPHVRPPVVQPGNGGQPHTGYQAPAPFILGQPNTGAGTAGQPQPPGAVGMNVQQNVNQMRNGAGGAAPTGNSGGEQRTGAQPGGGYHRRVVLPGQSQ